MLPLKKKELFLLSYVCDVLPACMFVYHMLLVATQGLALQSVVSWELNLVPLEEQQVLRC